jgi:plasmid stability protein
MGAITLRNLPRRVELRIRQEAARHGLSLNRAVLRLLEQAVGPEAPSGAAAEHDDLDHLAGAWSAREADRFEAALAEQRGVDEELWR